MPSTWLACHALVPPPPERQRGGSASPFCPLPGMPGRGTDLPVCHYAVLPTTTLLLTVVPALDEDMAPAAPARKEGDEVGFARSALALAGAGAGAASPASVGWDCRACTFANAPHCLACEMCEAPRA